MEHAPLFHGAAVRRAAALLTLVLLVAAAMPIGNAKSTEPQTLHLVRLAPSASAADVVASHGAELVAEYSEAGLAAVRLPDIRAKALARDPRVASVEADGIVRAASGSWNGASWDSGSWNSGSWNSGSWNSGSWNSGSWNGASWDGSEAQPGQQPFPWGLSAIGAPSAWASGTPERNRLVCLVDSGIDAAHPALASSLWRGADGSVGRDFVDDDATPQDEGGHGTHLAGIVAAARDPSLGVAGVGAPLVAMARVLDAQGHGSSSDVLAGIAWCAGIGADVVLLALAEDAPTLALRDAVAAAQRAGALVVASAGNSGPCSDCVSYPAAYPRVLAVGAVDPDRQAPSFSSAGREIDLLAPGVFVASTFPGGGVATGSGTSQAAAYVAGAAAFVWGKEPDWGAERVAQHLKRTAAPYGESGRDAESGAGVLDLAAAVRGL